MDPRSLAPLIAFTLALGAAGCTQRRGPVEPPAPAFQDRFAAGTQRLQHRAVVKTIARTPFVRVYPPQHPLAHVPYLGHRLQNMQDTDFVTVLFRNHFQAFAARFTEEMFSEPALDSEPEVIVELLLGKSRYKPEENLFSIQVTLRLLGPDGTVLYPRVVSAEIAGNPALDLSVPNQALSAAFRELAELVFEERGQIAQAIRDDSRDIALVEQVLLATAQRMGRSPQQNSDRNGRQFAVVIGISDYPGTRIDLDAARDDAIGLFRAVNDPANGVNFQDDRIALLLDGDATATNIRAALNKWLRQRVEPGDTVVIYFGGHGFYAEHMGDDDDRKKEKYFLPADYAPRPDRTLLQNIFAFGIPMDEITSYFSKLRAQNVLMIFDACYAGATLQADRTDELRRFSALNRRSTNAVLAAAGPQQKAIDGLFTGTLLEALGGRADGNGDGLVSVMEVVSYVSAEVPRRARIPQNPMFRANRTAPLERLPLSAY